MACQSFPGGLALGSPCRQGGNISNRGFLENLKKHSPRYSEGAEQMLVRSVGFLMQVDLNPTVDRPSSLSCQCPETQGPGKLG